MTTEFPYTQVAGTDAETFIQWKGTEVCIDLRCPCGHHGHVDDSFAYFVECGGCGAVYELGTAVAVRRVDREDARCLPRVAE